ncbi:hypothetical protein WDR10_14000 [Kurthia gibsonii]|uniref:hypothetical protein n=1 Tax=Kurthia gibsonii TaxID=33946 RepID=UPI0030CBFF47
MFPEYNPNNPELLESIVCFTDILGFSNLIKNTSDSDKGEILKDLHKHLNYCYKELDELNPYCSVKTFTDNIILAYPKHGDGESQYGSLITSFGRFQLNMILKGYFTRGGIALGNYYGDEIFAYGPALIEAYELESNKANYPRIVLSEKMVELISNHIAEFYGGSGAPQIQEILCDKEDNICFINYLECIEEDFQEGGNLSQYLEIIKSHKNQIESAIKYNLRNPKVMTKYSWVAKYHNYFCDIYVSPKIKYSCLEQYKVANLSSGNFVSVLERTIYR